MQTWLVRHAQKVLMFRAESPKSKVGKDVSDLSCNVSHSAAEPYHSVSHFLQCSVSLQPQTVAERTFQQNTLGMNHDICGLVDTPGWQSCIIFFYDVFSEKVPRFSATYLSPPVT